MNTDANKNSNNSIKLAGIEADHIKDKFPSLRFSEDILYMLSFIQKLLCTKQCDSTTGHKPDLIAIQILGLLFYHNTE